jgi:putative hemolysin
MWPVSTGVARLARISRATVLPVHVEARNGLLFHILAAIHPRVGALLLGRELLAKRFRSFRVRIGRPIPTEEIRAMRDEAEITTFLRREVEQLLPPVRTESVLEPLASEE